MGKNNSREAKAQHRLINFLRKKTTEHNMLKYRQINGMMLPYQLGYRNFLQDYYNNLIIVTETKHNQFDIIEIEKGGEIEKMDQAHKDRKAYLEGKGSLDENETKELNDIKKYEADLARDAKDANSGANDATKANAANAGQAHSKSEEKRHEAQKPQNPGNTNK